MPNWKAIGEYQDYIMFAEHYNWLPTEVDEQDPRILGEIRAFLAARSTVEAKHRNRPGRTK